MRVVMPECIKYQMLSQAHTALQHPGRNTLVRNLTRFWRISKTKETVSKITKQCDICQENKSYSTNYGEHEGQLESDSPFSFISSDIYGPIQSKHFVDDPEEVNWKPSFYILTISDIYSGFSQVTILKGITSETVIGAIRSLWLSKFPTPKTLLSDRGRQYTSDKFERFCRNEGIHHLLTSPYNPQSNGYSERINQAIGVTLRANKDTMVKELPGFIHHKINHNINRSTKLAPIEIIENKSPIDALQRDLSNTVSMGIRSRKEKNLNEQRKRNERRRAFSYTRGDLVYIKLHPTDKMEKRWKGPGEIISVNENGSVIISIDNHDIKQNIRNIRPYERGRCRGLDPFISSDRV